MGKSDHREKTFANGIERDGCITSHMYKKAGDRVIRQAGIPFRKNHVGSRPEDPVLAAFTAKTEKRRSLTFTPEQASTPICIIGAKKKTAHPLTSISILGHVGPDPPRPKP